jgi:formylglycine-generating enzyme required for sulfatase activity
MNRGETEDIKDGQLRVLRGGSFLNQARGIRSAFRLRSQPTYLFPDVGFRPARTFTP